ncbi:MAG: tRNA pseudouridine(38-40) synthase TruA [Candidatus Aminicenantia bacterium]
MTNYKVVIQYDGTDYKGWQYQPNQRTIQGEIERVLRIISYENVKVIGAGRTDSGVHAKGQVANFKIELKIAPFSLLRAMNSLLPKDTRIIDVEEVEDDFNARYHSKSKTYVYRIWRGLVVSPFIWRWVYHLPVKLDADKMRIAIKYFEGKNDFRNFTSRSSSPSTIRTIYRAEIEEEGDEIRFIFEGDGFLRYQVRNMVGLLIEIGKGKLEPYIVKELLEKEEVEVNFSSANPCGLCLEKVSF